MRAHMQYNRKEAPALAPAPAQRVDDAASPAATES